MKKITIFLLTTLICCLVVAKGGEHSSHGEAAIPLAEIGWQLANVGTLAVALIFFLKKSAKETFAKRQSEFLNKAEKTKEALRAAEGELSEIKNKLLQLEKGELVALTQANNEANIIKATIIKESEAQAAKLKRDAELVIHNELAKVKNEISQLILIEAIQAAKMKISSQAISNNSTSENLFLAQVEKSKNDKVVYA